MRILAFVLLAMSPIAVDAQRPQALSEAAVDSAYRKDELRGTLKDWSKAEVKAFRTDCERQLHGRVSDARAFCACARTAVAAHLNYSSFKEESEYQQGRIVGHFAGKDCR